MIIFQGDWKKMIMDMTKKKSQFVINNFSLVNV